MFQSPPCHTTYRSFVAAHLFQTRPTIRSPHHPCKAAALFPSGRGLVSLWRHSEFIVSSLWTARKSPPQNRVNVHNFHRISGAASVTLELRGIRHVMRFTASTHLETYDPRSHPTHQCLTTGSTMSWVRVSEPYGRFAATAHAALDPADEHLHPFQIQVWEKLTGELDLAETCTPA